METPASSDGLLIRLENRALLKASGPEVRDFLQGLVTNDVAKLSAGRSLYAALLTPQGKFLFDFFLIADGPDVLIDCNGARAADLLKRLSLYKLRAKVTLEPLEDGRAVWAATGPKGLAAQTLEAEPGTARASEGVIAYTDPRHAGLGARLVTSGAGFEPTASLEDYDTLRIALGIPEGGKDILPDKSFLLECNMEEMHAIDFKKGCYIGQETTARTKHRGSIRKRVLPVELGTDIPEPGTSVTAGGREIGTLTSGRGSRALASIRLDRLEEAESEGHMPEVNGRPVIILKPDWVTA